MTILQKKNQELQTIDCLKRLVYFLIFARTFNRFNAKGKELLVLITFRFLHYTLYVNKEKHFKKTFNPKIVDYSMYKSKLNILPLI